ncbi:hypothetical protein Tco_1411810, partial [Tanacetum coccineum]
DELLQNQERWNLKSWNFYENCGVHTLTLEDGTEIHMLAERKYPLTKETLERMMSLNLIAESASESAYNLLRHQELASPEQMASGKDFSNPLMADSLPKTICFSTHHALHYMVINAPCYCNEALAIPEQTATGKEISNLFMAVSLDLSRLATTLNRLVRSIQTGINKWYQSLLRNSELSYMENYTKGKLSSTSLNRYKWKIRILPPKTTKEILARERERKARTTLVMSILKDHLAKFHKMTDAKEMWEAIKSRFGGNDESKKMHKYILK